MGVELAAGGAVGRAGHGHIAAAGLPHAKFHVRLARAGEDAAQPHNPDGERRAPRGAKIKGGWAPGSQPPRGWGALTPRGNRKRNGRTGGPQPMRGSLLSIKPIVDVSTGEVSRGKGPAALHRMGPYSDEATARRAIEIAAEMKTFGPAVPGMGSGCAKSVCR